MVLCEMMLSKLFKQVTFFRVKRLYRKLPGAEDEENTKKPDACIEWPSTTIVYQGLLILILLPLLVIILTQVLLSQSDTSGQSARRCKNPVIRREWRSLSQDEREDFTRAVNCLATIPSSWQQNGTLYSDFTVLHGGIGSWSHRSASFLPWHRYALVIWERTLQQHCGFQGHVPYWDWTRDWMGLSESSIWDSETGFGGDGDPAGAETVGNGRCVVDGPFSHLRPIIYNHTYEEHCLSRGFSDGNISGRMNGTYFSPESIGHITRRSSYVLFERDVEYKLHNTMHQAIQGDFLALTAANDPIFFVHHAQIDHLWWQWQNENSEKRLVEYEGKHMHNSTSDTASLQDMLYYGGLVDNIPVFKVMDTEFLCYKY